MPLTTLTVMERVLFLHEVSLFSRLDPSDIQAIARVATERAFGDAEVVFRQGDRGDALYLVTSGALRIQQDGREIARRGRGEIVGEMAIIRDAPRAATVDASGETKTLRIARADFESILRDRPETALGVIQVLATRLVEANAAR
jgi:CRP-like cAMP-binding protein